MKCSASLGNGRLLSGIIGHVMRKGIPVPFCFVTKYELHKFDTVGFIPEGVRDRRLSTFSSRRRIVRLVLSIVELFDCSARCLLLVLVVE